MGATPDPDRASLCRSRGLMASKSALNSRRTIRRFWCWTANLRPSRSTRCFSSRKADSPGSTPRVRTSSSFSARSRPTRRRAAVAYLLGNAAEAVKPAHINTNFAYCGGGFGGRDHTPFPLYVALAAMFFPNRPVRLANNRYEQFQSGIKRHAFKMRTQIGVDRSTGKIVGFAADHALDGGGLANFSANVATVGRQHGARHLLCPESRRHHVCVPLARRDRGLDARLRNACRR